ncbi:hypothetical protein MKK88_02500 [Methylobacterium sp. E-005]|uniref:hypothetical protein n=1 Tax=Methylobacterium sp. E-005 TaxID=2836549 RepID=UPI001FBAF3B4|nr:hypothetical protein [Methylobacterium sp. E-005]MCJ2084864.1 hypothetical protein [Methylobacterium sp. E-005]
MPAQHGQTYDPLREPAPHGGWFGFVERPYPERLDRAFRGLAIAVAAVALVGMSIVIVVYAKKPPADVSGYAWIGGTVLALSALAYGAVRALGMILVGIFGTLRDGSEFVVDWRALRHDLRLRRTRILLLEAALLLAAQGGALWGLALLVRKSSVYGGAMFVLIEVMTYWPLLRRWITTGQPPA